MFSRISVAGKIEAEATRTYKCEREKEIKKVSGPKSKQVPYLWLTFDNLKMEAPPQEGN